MERLTDGPSVKFNSEMQQSIDPRALAIRNANKPQMGPNGRPRPPPLRSRLVRPGGTVPNSVKAARAAQGRRRVSHESNVEAPSILAKPIDQKRVLQ